MKEIIINIAIILLEMIAIILGITTIVISFTICDKDTLTLVAGCLITIGYIILFGKTIYRIAYDKATDDIDAELEEMENKVAEINRYNNELNNIINKKNQLINEYIAQYGAITDAE